MGLEKLIADEITKALADHYCRIFPYEHEASMIPAIAKRVLAQVVRALRPDLLATRKKKTIQIMLSEGCSFEYNTHRFNTVRQADRFIDKCEAEDRPSFGPFDLEVVLPINKETGLVRESDVLELLREAVSSTH